MPLPGPTDAAPGRLAPGRRGSPAVGTSTVPLPDGAVVGVDASTGGVESTLTVPRVDPATLEPAAAAGEAATPAAVAAAELWPDCGAAGAIAVDVVACVGATVVAATPAGSRARSQATSASSGSARTQSNRAALVLL